MIGSFCHALATLIMNGASVGGYDRVMEAYKKALANGYRFVCFGDAMLILND